MLSTETSIDRPIFLAMPRRLAFSPTIRAVMWTPVAAVLRSAVVEDVGHWPPIATRIAAGTNAESILIFFNMVDRRARLCGLVGRG